MEREREREREKETGACTSFQENQSASADPQVERERERDYMVLAHESFVLACLLESRINQSILLQLLPMRTHERIQKVSSEGPTLTTFFLLFF